MTFTFKTAVREKVGLLIGLCGGTGSGKTFSALRMASGIAGGKPFALIDTEAGRAKHYADQFKFDHGDLRAPFRPESYTEAIQAADAAGYPVIVVDSMSHVWAGDGGVLDWHEDELDRMAGDDWKKREAVNMAAWIKPKMAHKKMVQSLLQVRAHLILCFRAEEKIEMIREDGRMKIVPKQSLTGLSGWIPVCEKALPFELTVSMLLTADAPGVGKAIKLQEQHRALFPAGAEIGEDAGKRIAEWADGGASPAALNKSALETVLLSIKSAMTPVQMAKAATACLALGDDDKAIARKAYATRQKELKAASATADVAITYAEIADKINKAQNVDQLAISRDLIRSIADEEQRQELMALANDREANEFANIE